MLGLDPALGARRALRRAAAGAGRGGRAPTRSTCPRRPSAATCRSAPTAASPTTSASAATAARSTDARRAAVRFAAECLAFANVPTSGSTTLPGAAGGVVHDPAGRPACRATSAAAGTSTTCATTTSQLLFGVDPGELRSVDHERYLELSRAVSGEVMAEVFGEWRRAGSPLRRRARALAARPGRRRRLGRARPPRARPRSPTTTCAGRSRRSRSGPPTRASAASPSTSPTTARAAARAPAGRALPRLRAAGRRGRARIVELAPARRPRAQRRGAARPLRRRVVGLSLRPAGPGRDRRQPRADARRAELLSQAFRFPAGRPLARRAGRPPRARGDAPSPATTAAVRLTRRSRRLAYGVRVHAAGFAADDDAFSVEPGGAQRGRPAPARAGRELRGRRAHRAQPRRPDRVTTADAAR